MNARILIVEDSPTVRRMIRATLEEAGHGVAECADGSEALRVLEAQPEPPDLVITDVNMPEMDGITLVRAIRGVAALRFLPVLVLTTESSDEMKRRGREAGATGWVVKPFERARLQRAVGEVLGRRVNA